MKNWTLSRRLSATLLVIITLLMVGQIVSWFIERRFAQEELRANATRDKLLLNAARIKYAILQVSDALRGLLLSPGSTVENSRKSQGDADMGKAIREMRVAVDATGESELKNSLDVLSDYNDKNLTVTVTKVMKLLDKNPTGAAETYATDYLLAREHLDRFVTQFNIRVEKASVRQSDRSSAAQMVGLGIIILILIMSAWLGRSLNNSIQKPLRDLGEAMQRLRSGDFSQKMKVEGMDEFSVLADGLNRTCDDLGVLVGQVQRSGIQVNTSLTQISATAREQQATANEIAATTTEIGATAKEIAATSIELQRSVAEVAKVAEHTAALANTGQTALSRMEHTIRQITEAASAISNKLNVLNEKAANINQVVATITKVADQTNLLSLNAAIEAEKAGEYGRGFAVVATEIRRLADQTAVATYDIEQTVKEMQSAVAAGVMGMDKFSDEVRRGVTEVSQVGTQLNEIIIQVQTLTPRFESVNGGMNAQATGARQTSEALSHLSEAGQQIAEAANQSNVAIDQLTEAVSRLWDAISKFKLS